MVVLCWRVVLARMCSNSTILWYSDVVLLQTLTCRSSLLLWRVSACVSGIAWQRSRMVTIQQRLPVHIHWLQQGGASAPWVSVCPRGIGVRAHQMQGISKRSTSSSHPAEGDTALHATTAQSARQQAWRLRSQPHRQLEGFAGHLCATPSHNQTPTPLITRTAHCNAAAHVRRH